MTADLEPEILKKRNLTKGRSRLSFFAKITPTPLFFIYMRQKQRIRIDYFLRRLGVKLISSAGINTALSFVKTSSP